MSRNWMALALAGVLTAAAGCGGAGGSKPASSDRKQGLPESTFKVVVRGENAYWDPSTSSTVILPRGGVVTSDVGGLSCGVDGAGGLHKVCSIDAAYATTVVLTATASSAGWVHGWAGACSGMADTCAVYLGSDRLAVIRFAATTTGLGAHSNFSDPAVHVVEVMKFGQPNAYRCTDCHGATLQGMGIAPACATATCHPTTPAYPPGFVHPVDGTFGVPALHGPGWVTKPATCGGCHGDTLAGSTFTPGCTKCHPKPHVPSAYGQVIPGVPDAMKAPAHTAPALAAIGTTDCSTCHDQTRPTQLAPSCTSCHAMTHGATYTTHGLAYVTNGDQCRYCHSTPQSASGTLNGGLTAPSCAAVNCHSPAGAMPHVVGSFDPVAHGSAYVTNPIGCKGCHGQTLSGATPPLQAPSCSKCHATPHDVGVMAPPAHTTPAIAAGGTTACTACHAAGNPGQLAPSCMSCHQLTHPVALGLDPGWAASAEHGWQYAAGEAAGTIACVACHGGPALTGGVPPMTAPSCGSCHAWPVGSGKHFLATEVAWGNNSPSGWAQACQRCHVSDGFRDYTGGFWTSDTVPPPYLSGSFVGSNTTTAGTGLPGAYATGTLKCQSCHNPQSEPTGNSTLAPSNYDGDNYGLVGIQFPSMNQAYADKVVTLCAQCHQGRNSTPGLNAYINGLSATANQGLTAVTLTATGGTVDGVAGTSTLNATGLVLHAVKGFTAIFVGNPTSALNGISCPVVDNTATAITLGCVLPVTPGAETVTLYPTTTSGSGTTLVDSNRAWTAGQWTGRYVYFYRTVDGSTKPTYVKITGNTAGNPNSLTFALGPPPVAAGMYYQILPNEIAAALDAQLVGATYQSPHEMGAAATFLGSDAAGYYQYPLTYDATPKTNPYLNQAGHAGVLCTECHDAHALAIPSTFVCGATCHSGTHTHSGTSDQTMNGLKGKSGVWYMGGTDQGVYANYTQMMAKLYTAIQQYSLTNGNVGAGTKVICFNQSDASHLDFFVGTAVGQTDGACPSSTPWGQAGSNTAYTPRLLRAVYNYKFLVQDPGAWAHNPKYVTDVMYDAIRDLNMGIPVANQINMTGWNRP